MSNRHDSQPTILFVEDSIDEQLLVLRAIKQTSLACQVLAVGSTGEALDYLLARNAFFGRPLGNPDAIFADGAYAGLIGEIRARESLKLIPVVVLAGSSDPSKVDEFYRLGANSFLEKPTDFADFAALIANAVRYWTYYNRSINRRRGARSFPYTL